MANQNLKMSSRGLRKWLLEMMIGMFFVVRIDDMIRQFVN